MPESNDKRLATFVHRVRERMKEDPKASLSARHRMAFIAARDLVEAAIGGGGTMKAIWQTLREDGTLSMTYETFRGHCREFGIRRRRRARAAKRDGVASASARSVARQTSTAADPEKTRSPHGAERPKEFRHDPVPRLDKIYG